MHKVLYRRWLNELWSGRCTAAELVSDDFVGHWPNRDVRGPAELQSVVDQTRETLKELQFVLDVGPFQEGDLVGAGGSVPDPPTADRPATPATT